MSLIEKSAKHVMRIEFSIMEHVPKPWGQDVKATQSSTSVAQL